MLRLRRYRVFLVFAIFAVIALYKFGNSSSAWREAASSAAGAAGFRGGGGQAPQLDTKPRPAVAYETKSLRLDVPAASQPQVLQTPPPVKKPSPSPSSIPAVTEKPQIPQIPTQIRPGAHVQPLDPAHPIDPLPVSESIEIVHWSKQSQHFPVASESLIKLPSGKPKPIPKIQFKFQPEDEATKADRLEKLDLIRDVAKKTWDGYKKYAWLHDELKPQSGTFSDPFAKWGATLVDSLDTLWIMGMKDDFEEAVEAVGEIDFTTSPRPDIPVFETTIRYLGGLLGAYDLSEQKHKKLLDKAVELAEVLIGTFDTPNRMPNTYYYWKPQFASQRHRASQNVVLAEFASLSMEFTRLAQITGEHKYYDAIARITNNLEDIQNTTRLPGMWPTSLDISGCGKVYLDSTAQEPLKAPVGYFDEAESEAADATSATTSAAPGVTEELSPGGNKYVPLDLPPPVLLVDDSPPKSPTNVGSPEDSQVIDWSGTPLEKRQLDTDLVEPLNAGLGADEVTPAQAASASQALPTPPECVPQGFMSVSGYGREGFTLGGESDSAYEYLSKQYLLLGGLVEKYRTMYEAAADTVKQHLIFRPMLPNEDDILFSGKLYVPSIVDESHVGDINGENAHLICFAGGMFATGAKLFDRPEDLEIAKKLADGCIWSYDMTASGIMPESFETIPCKSKENCAWNETAYWETLDPQHENRIANYKIQLKAYEERMVSASHWYEAQVASMTAAPEISPHVVAAAPAIPTGTVWADTLDRRQLADLVDDAEIAHMPVSSTGTEQDRESVMGGESEEGEGPPTKVQTNLNIPELMPQPSRALPVFPVLYSPYPPMNHKDYVQNRIQEERLPAGVTRIGARQYILR